MDTPVPLSFRDVLAVSTDVAGYVHEQTRKKRVQIERTPGTQHSHSDRPPDPAISAVNVNVSTIQVGHLKTLYACLLHERKSLLTINSRYLLFWMADLSSTWYPAILMNNWICQSIQRSIGELTRTVEQGSCIVYARGQGWFIIFAWFYVAGESSFIIHVMHSLFGYSWCGWKILEEWHKRSFYFSSSRIFYLENYIKSR